MKNPPSAVPAFWSAASDEVLAKLGSTRDGLSAEIAAERLETARASGLKVHRPPAALVELVGQFRSPIVLILIFAAILSFLVHDRTNALIILAIVLASGLLGFWQEHGAAGAVAKLLSLVQVKACVLRSGQRISVPSHEVVPGDIIFVSAGDKIPGDCLLLESKDLYVNEAALTGETFPVDKAVAVLPEETPLNKRSNCLFMGTNVVSGSGTALVVLVGEDTEFGQVSAHLAMAAPETEFERGIRRFGNLLAEITLLLVLGIFAVNVFLHRPVLDSFMFALALAVGLTPQLLPAIISINLAHGARRMAEAKVIVKRLSAIENFGSMNVLCSDKTGTLTEGVVRLQGSFDLDGHPCDRVLLLAYLNAKFESGFANPIDEAVRSAPAPEISKFTKLDEVPYDFIRKRLSILVSGEGRAMLVAKGALSNVLDVCTSVRSGDETLPLEGERAKIEAKLREFSERGLRTLGVASRRFDDAQPSQVSKSDEVDMVFEGFLVLADPPKSGVQDTLVQLKNLGVALKMITGDNAAVARHVGREVGLNPDRIITGPELSQMSNEALRVRAATADIFAEIEPNQKERIIVALRKANNVVGYMGDGINDASALHAADVGISVASAVDVAKDAAQIVLLEQDLEVLVDGVREGRITFANTLKYVFMATSANFGNMFSMAGASLFLPFLPLLPKQILLTNLLTDFPEMTIATDAVDPEMVEQPRRWDIGFIRKFMLTFGLLSSVFDYLTFGVLRILMHAGPTEFRTGWFIESVLSASLIVLVIRTRRPFFRSRPGKALTGVTLTMAVATVALPFTPFGGLFSFGPVPPGFILAMVLVMIFYIAAAEITKHFYYKSQNSSPRIGQL